MRKIAISLLIVIVNIYMLLHTPFMSPIIIGIAICILIISIAMYITGDHYENLAKKTLEEDSNIRADNTRLR